jgi:hypothetical protein
MVTLAYGAAEETKVNFKDLPSAVQKTAKEQERNGATVRGYNKEVEKGKTFYEVETRVKGKSRDILMDESGSIVEVEQQVDISSVPGEAMEGLKREAGGAIIRTVEFVTRGDKISYEAEIQKNGNKKEIAVNADGSAVREP